MIENYTIKNGMKPPVNLSWRTILGILLGLILLIVAWIQLDLLGGFYIPVALSVVYIPFISYCISLDAKKAGFKLKKYLSDLSINFYCPSCGLKLYDYIPHENTNGLPLLYECEHCLTLWYVGNSSEKD